MPHTYVDNRKLCFCGKKWVWIELWLCGNYLLTARRKYIFSPQYLANNCQMQCCVNRYWNWMEFAEWIVWLECCWKRFITTIVFYVSYKVLAFYSFNHLKFYYENKLWHNKVVFENACAYKYILQLNMRIIIRVLVWIFYVCTCDVVFVLLILYPFPKITIWNQSDTICW